MDKYRSAPIQSILNGAINEGGKFPTLKKEESSLLFFAKSIGLGFCLVMASTIGKIFFKQMTNKMPNYPFFLSVFIILAALPAYFIIYLILEARQVLSVLEKVRNTNQEIEKIYWEKRKNRGYFFEKRKLFIMGILDSLAGILMVYGGKGTSGTLQTLLFQAVIPLTMILAIVILKEKYTFLQYVGAFGVVLGVFVAFYPSLGSGGNLVYVLVYFSSVIPTAVSSIYKEYSLKKMFVNMFYLQAWVSLFQVLTSFAFLPINIVPVIGGIQIQDIPKNIIDGTKCFVGTPTTKGDDCHWAFVPVLGYAVANFLFNLLSLYILKSLSSAIVYIQNTVRLPLVAIAFHMPWIMDKDVIPWGLDDLFTFGGLVLIITGLALYMRDAIKKNKRRLPLYPSLLPPESLSIKYNTAPLPVLMDSETFDMDTNVKINLLNIN